MHRNYKGKISYLKDGAGETGRESFSVSVHADGSRTLRAECEMDEFELLRDVIQSIDAEWRPVDSYVRLSVGGALSGSAWYRFDDCRAECRGLTGDLKYFEDQQSTDEPIQSFGSHSLQNDAWLVARVRQRKADLGSLAGSTFTTSLSANGGTGPTLVRVPPVSLLIRDLGLETITVEAGRFETWHVRVEVKDVDCFDIWAAGEDCVPVRLTSDGLRQSFELVELLGDPR